MTNTIKTVAEATFAITLAVILLPVGVAAFLLLWAMDVHLGWKNRKHSKTSPRRRNTNDYDRMTMSKIF